MQMLGHDAPPQTYWRENIVSGAPLAECPLRTILRAREHDAIALELDEYQRTLYPMFKAGHLLLAGGVADQPARYVEVITMLQRAEQDEQRAFDRLQDTKRQQQPE